MNLHQTFLEQIAYKCPQHDRQRTKGQANRCVRLFRDRFDRGAVRCVVCGVVECDGLSSRDIYMLLWLMGFGCPYISGICTVDTMILTD